MTLVQTVTVGAGGAASIEFTNIPQTGQDLYVVFSTRSLTTEDQMRIRINGSTASIYSRRRLAGNGSTAFSESVSGIDHLPFYGVDRSNWTASTFSSVSIYIPNYTASASKSISIDSVTENNATLAMSEISAGLFASNSAITSIQLAGNSGNLDQYSTASLYTISTTGATGATVS